MDSQDHIVSEMTSQIPELGFETNNTVQLLQMLQEYPPLKGAELLRFEAQNWTHRNLHPDSHPLRLYNPAQGIPIHPPETKQYEQ